MARLIIPNQKQVELYNKLVQNQNKVRRTLIRIHKENEEASGAGRLPALVIPKRARRIPLRYFESLRRKIKEQGKNSKEGKRAIEAIKKFWSSYRQAKSLFGAGIKSYIARTVKQGYLDLWRDQILFMAGEPPKGNFNYYTKEQIEGSYMGAFMEVYNMLNRFSPEVFLALLYTGKIIAFKYIYQDMISGTGEKENSWLSQQAELLSLYKSPQARRELLEESVTNLIEYKHSKKTLRKAERAKREDDLREERRQKRAEKAKGGK